MSSSAGHPLNDPSTTAVVVVDLQNDFLTEGGAYVRGGVDTTLLRNAADQAATVVEAARQAGVVVISTHFTLVPDRHGEAMIAPHLGKVRPFLRTGDFVSGSWGHANIDAIGETTLGVDKVAYSAFAHTNLGWWLEKSRISDLIICGIVSNGGVASTAREAHVREFGVTVVSDATAAVDPRVHEATMVSLGSVVGVQSSADVIGRWG